MHCKIDTAWISYEVVQKLQDGGEYRQRFRSERKVKEEVRSGCTNTNRRDILLWTRRPTEGNLSELEARADAFWNVLERQLLVSANAP
jgi:hypothetical protein